MAVIFPLIAIYIINNAKLINYVKNPTATFNQLGNNITNLAVADVVILSSGFIGAIASGITIKILRKKGYQMF